MRLNANVASPRLYVVVESVLTEGRKSHGMLRDCVAANGNAEIVTARFATRTDALRVAADCQDGQLDAFSWYVLDSRETDTASYTAKHVNRLPRHLKEILQEEQSRARKREEAAPDNR